MKAQILIKKKVKARDITEGMNKIRKKYPNSVYVRYKFDKLENRSHPMTEADWKRRTMTIAFVDDRLGVDLE